MSKVKQVRVLVWVNSNFPFAALMTVPQYEKLCQDVANGIEFEGSRHGMVTFTCEDGAVAHVSSTQVKAIIKADISAQDK